MTWQWQQLGFLPVWTGGFFHNNNRQQQMQFNQHYNSFLHLDSALGREECSVQAYALDLPPGLLQACSMLYSLSSPKHYLQIISKNAKANNRTSL